MEEGLPEGREVADADKVAEAVGVDAEAVLATAWSLLTRDGQNKKHVSDNALL